MSDISRRSRESKGKATGGQFKREVKPESNVRLARFAPTPGYIKHQQWVSENLPKSMQELVEPSDSASLYLATKNGQHHIEVKPGKDTDFRPTTTEFIGEAGAEYAQPERSHSTSDRHAEMHWAYREALSNEVANTNGKYHFKDFSEVKGETLRKVSTVPGQTLPEVTLEYDTGPSETPKTETLPLFQLDESSPAYRRSTNYFLSLSADPDYSPGYQQYAKSALENDRLHRHNRVPEAMMHDCLEHLYWRDFQSTSAKLDSTGRYLEFTADLGMGANYKLLYDSETSAVGGYFSTEGDEDFQTDPETPEDDPYPVAFMRKHKPPMEELHNRVSAEKKTIASSIRLRQQTTN